MIEFYPTEDKESRGSIAMTSYTTLEVQNFKGIREMKLDGLGMVNVFVGGNNVGKTSVLQAIATANQGRFDLKTLKVYISELFNDSNDVLNYSDEELSEGILDSFLTYSILGLENLPKDRLHKEENDWFVNLDKKIKAFFYYQKASVKTVNIRVDDYLFKSYKTANGIIKYCFENGDINCIPDSISSHHSVYRPRKISFKLKNNKSYIATNTFLNSTFVLSVWDSVVPKSSVFLSNLILQLKKIEDRVEDIRRENDHLEIYLKDLDAPLPLDSMGDGFVKLFAIICLLFIYKGQTLFIDEIENGFHWSVQKDMWRMILTAAKDDGTQFFFTTHSYEVLESLNAVLQEMKETGDDLTVAPKDAEGNPVTTQEPLDLACVFRLKKDDTDKVTAKKFVGEKLDLFVASKAEIR